MSTYSDLKAELFEIAKIIELYPDNLKAEVFQILTKNFLGSNSEALQIPEIDNGNSMSRANPISSPKSSTGRKSQRRPSESYEIDRNLNLRGNNEISSLSDFVNQKQPKTNVEVNTVVVYYLQLLLKIEKPTLSQVYTCYKEIKRKPPERFRQSFINMKNRRGLLEIKGDELNIPIRGINFVEHDLPAKGNLE